RSRGRGIQETRDRRDVVAVEDRHILDRVRVQRRRVAVLARFGAYLRVIPINRNLLFQVRDFQLDSYGSRRTRSGANVHRRWFESFTHRDEVVTAGTDSLK